MTTKKITTIKVPRGTVLVPLWDLRAMAYRLLEVGGAPSRERAEALKTLGLPSFAAGTNSRGLMQAAIEQLDTIIDAMAESAGENND